MRRGVGWNLCGPQQRLVESEALNAKKLTVLLQAVDQRKLRIEDRHSVPVFDGQKMAFWVVPSLREMFRGLRTPPADMDRYPPEYCPHFFFIEDHVLTACLSNRSS